jgi:cytidylate kinase
VQLLGELAVECGVRDGHSTITVGGVDPGEELRSDVVNAAVSSVSAVPEVRDVLVAQQRKMLQIGDLVMEGRDIGSVVFPETRFKFYIDASEEVRRQRRAAEGQQDEVGERDRQDAARKTSPLVIPDGALVIDSSELAIEEVVERAMVGLRERGWFERDSQEVRS